MKSKLLFLLLLCCSQITFAASVNFISTPNAPKPLGSYSQAVSVDPKAGRLVFVAGQIANDKNGKLYESDIRVATRLALNNIATVLKASGSDLEHVVRMDVFLKDFSDWDAMNEEYAKFFHNNRYPARQTVQVGMENRIEISCIAVAPYK
jgi:2-iminobutanoate/2-iminopropanoate deaminase